MKKLYPDAGSVLDVGREGAAAYVFEDGSIEDFAMNTVCGAGGGGVMGGSEKSRDGGG